MRASTASTKVPRHRPSSAANQLDVMATTFGAVHRHTIVESSSAAGKAAFSHVAG